MGGKGNVPRWALFDFDGTIADTAHIAYEVYRRLARKYDREVLDREAFEALNDRSIPKRLKAHGVSVMRLPGLVRQALPIYRDEVSTARPFPGMGDCLERLREEGISLAILSSNHEETIRTFLIEHDLGHFESIQGKVAILGKARGIRRFLKKKALAADDILYVGDEIRDVEAAKKAGIPVIAVGWGYDEEKLLESAAPDDYVQSPDQLVETILRRIETT